MGNSPLMKGAGRPPGDLSDGITDGWRETGKRKAGSRFVGSAQSSVDELEGIGGGAVDVDGPAGGDEVVEQSADAVR
jgi:hypothetical protein